jgi:hypothetical protein
MPSIVICVNLNQDSAKVVKEEIEVCGFVRICCLNIADVFAERPR